MTLLGEIISSNNILQNKYSKALDNLSAVILLERDETKDKLPKSLFNDFEEIKSKCNNLTALTKNVPLLILEQYYVRNFRDLSREIYVEWNDDAFEIKIKELYLILEKYFYEMYIMAIRIADFYNLEFKLKKGKEDTSSFI